MAEDAIVVSQRGLELLLDNLTKIREVLAEQIVDIAVEQEWVRAEIKRYKEGM